MLDVLVGVAVRRVPQQTPSLVRADGPRDGWPSSRRVACHVCGKERSDLQGGAHGCSACASFLKRAGHEDCLWLLSGSNAALRSDCRHE